MFNINKKNKEYTVIINSKSFNTEVDVLAKNKKEALKILENVILKCEFFKIKSKDEFKLSLKNGFLRK